ncbi:MAG: hypothetical protein U1E60_00530 [Reyranellaceae bacterium]
MPCTNFPIDPIGPVLEMGIAPAASLRSRDAPPPILWFKALADTGCSDTSIHTSLAVRCGLQIISTGAATTPTGILPVNLFHADLFLRAVGWEAEVQRPMHDRTLVELTHGDPTVDVQLGMDILNLDVFTTNGGTRQSTFCR